ncbi:MAG: hypothetical protein U0074_05575 [Kouleothrix sp.]
MARILRRSTEAAMWQRKSDALAERMVARFYDRKAGLFWSQKDHQPIRVLTPFSCTRLDRAMPQKIADKLAGCAFT